MKEVKSNHRNLFSLLVCIDNAMTAIMKVQRSLVLFSSNQSAHGPTGKCGV